MNLLLIIPSLIAAILLVVILVTRQMTFFTLKYKLLKKKGFIPLIEVTKDKQVKLGVEKPDEDNCIKAEEGEKEAKQIQGSKLYWFQPFNSRIAFTKQGDRDIFDPYEKGKGGGIASETVDRIAKQAKLQGQLEGQNMVPQIRGIVILIGIGIVICIALNWFNLQNTGKIIEQIARAGAPVAKQAAETAAKNMTMN